MKSSLSLLSLVTLLTFGAPAGAGEGASPLATERRVHGVITAVDPAVVTIASMQRSVSGRVDPARTKVTIDGKPAKLADLMITKHAKAELCLDDVWLRIDAHDSH